MFEAIESFIDFDIANRSDPVEFTTDEAAFVTRQPDRGVAPQVLTDIWKAHLRSAFYHSSSSNSVLRETVWTMADR